MSSRAIRAVGGQTPLRRVANAAGEATARPHASGVGALCGLADPHAPFASEVISAVAGVGEVRS